MPRFLDRLRRAPACLATCLLGLATGDAFAYNLDPYRWSQSTVTMQLQLGSFTGSLIDGSTSWGAVAEDALASWNSNLTNLQFKVVRDSTAPIAQGNALNNVFWSSTVYGAAWDSRTLAITLNRFSSNTNRYTEADIVFNNTKSWNSYRGNLRNSAADGSIYDFRRVALHEFGHAIGLMHPDAVGQVVVAIMNADTSNTDNLTADDINGARAIYDSPGSLASLPTIAAVVSFSSNPQNANLNLRATRLTNEGNTASNTLRLEAWVMPQHYDNGLPPGSRLLGAYAFSAPLAAGASFSNVDVNTFYSPPPGGTYYQALLLTEFVGGSGYGYAIRDHVEFTNQVTVTSAPRPTVRLQPNSQTVTQGAPVTFSMDGSDNATSFQWQRNGVNLTGFIGTSFTIGSVQPSNTGVYQAVIGNGAGSINTRFALLGLATTSKVLGAGSEIAANIQHANGNVFDQILLDGAAATFTADAAQNQITRLSFVDLSNDIVQVEFSGAGSVSIVLDSPTGPAIAANYNQPAIAYMKGHAGIVVTGANETTNLSVFSVGRGNAVNQALFLDNVVYDGMADLAFIAIASSNGKFGGLRTANAVYSHSRGLVGIYAPGIEFTGPVFIGDITASQSATPMLAFGAASDVRITGGDLLQTNARPVQVSGLTQLQFVLGSTSHHTTADPHLLPAQTNKARLEQDGADVTTQLVLNP